MRPKRRQIYAEAAEGGLDLTAIGEVRIVSRLGEGANCVVYLGSWKDSTVALKVYKAAAVERHARYHPQELAEFEYRRNLAFYEAPDMARYVARPLAYLFSGGVSAMVQERLEGQLYYHYYRLREGKVAASLFQHVRRIVELAHRAELYDIGLHSGNVMVVEEHGEPIPKLFDFNVIPFYIHPPSPLVALLVKTGILDRRSRDLRKLRNFHDFTGVERKLERFAGMGPG